MSTNIISLLEDDIPEFLKSSPYLQSLTTDEVFPSGGIEVPADCIKTNTRVTSISDLECLLKTVRYWLLPDLLVDLLELHVFVFDPKNEADVVQVLDNFKTELTYVNTLLPLVSCNMEQKICFAAGRGFVTLLDFLCKENGDKPIDWQSVIYSATIKGQLSCLQFLRAQGCPWDSNSLHVAARNGHVDCFIFFVEECGAKVEAFHVNILFCEAANGSHTDVMRYLHKKYGLPEEHTQVTTYGSAATSGNLEAMEFLDILGFATGRDVFSTAAGKGHVRVLKHLVSKFGVPGEVEAQRAWKLAAEQGKLEVLQFLHAHVSPPRLLGNQNDDEDGEDTLAVMCAAVKSGNIPCIAFLREVGHPWNDCLTKLAAKRQDSELFWYLIEQGCPCSEDECSRVFAKRGSLCDLVRYRDKKLPWGADTCACVAAAGHLECLQFLVENGCPVHYDKICESAAQHLDCLTYAHQLGGKLTTTTAVQAARDGAKECLGYMHANGCTFTVEVANATVLCVIRPHMESLQLLLDAGCPVNSETCRLAATRHWCPGPDGTAEAQLACLKLLHERGCPWDERTCVAAADNDFLAGLQYAIEHGCPWGEETKAAAARSDYLAGQYYAMMHGRDWDEQTKAAAGPNCAAYMASLTGLEWKSPTDRDYW